MSMQTHYDQRPLQAAHAVDHDPDTGDRAAAIAGIGFGCGVDAAFDAMDAAADSMLRFDAASRGIFRMVLARARERV